MNKHLLLLVAITQVGVCTHAASGGRAPSVAHYNQPMVRPGNSGHTKAPKAQLISGLGTFDPITGPTTISAAGQYVVNNDFNVSTGTGIAITASDVILDIDNRNINGTGGTTGVSIATGLTNVVVGNGTIRGMTGAGISVEADHSIVIDCDLIDNAAGVTVSGAENVLVDDCRAIGNSVAGFSFDGCTNNHIINCVAYKNGSDDTAHGFVSTGGTGNKFESCVANGTTTTATASDVIATGFMLDVEETQSSIIQCQSIRTNTPTQGNAKAYGILLETDFEGVLTPLAAETFGSGLLLASAWSSNGALLAIAGNPESGVGLRIYSFNGRRLQFKSELNNGTIERSVAWSPNNEYLALAGDSGDAFYTMRVYRLDGDEIKQIAFTLNSNAVNSVDWSADGKFLATGDVNGDIIVYEFDGNLLTQMDSVSHGDVVNAVRWSADGHLAIGGVPASSIDVRVYSFDGSTLTEEATANHGANINAIDWAPSSKFLAAVGEDASGVDTELYAFDGSSLTSADTAAHGATVYSVRFSADGLHMLTAGETETTNNTELNIYAVDNDTLTSISSPVFGAAAHSATWSPNKHYVCVAGDLTAENPENQEPILNLRVFQAEYTGAAKCAIHGNSVTHTTGSYTTGVGVQADSLNNLVVENKAFNNDINYQLTTNVYDRGLAGTPTLIQNIGLPPV